jgi:hypothetical protein
MSILPFLARTSFDPDMTAVLTSAFDTAWSRVKSSGSTLAASDTAAATRELLAKTIIAAAQAGERNENRLVENALASLALDPGAHLSAPKEAPST